MNLRCVWYQRELARHADLPEGLLPGSRAAGHVEGCEGCRAAWAGLRRLGTELQDTLAVPPATPFLEEQAWSRIDATEPRLSRSPRLAVALGAGAAAAVLAGLIALHPWENASSPHVIARLGLPHPTRPWPTGERNHAGSHPPAEQRAPSVTPAPRAPVPSFHHRLRGYPENGARGFGPSKPTANAPHGAPLGTRVPAMSLHAWHGTAKMPRHPRPAPAVVPPASLPDDPFLDGRDPSLLAEWGPVDQKKEQQRLEALLRQLPPPADDFVRVPLPRIAAGGEGSAALAAAAHEYQQQAKVVDARLFRKVTLALKGASLSDFAAQMQAQTGVELRAARGVADEKLTVFVKQLRARDVMRAVARLFGCLWSRSGEAGAYRYEMNQDLRSQLMEEELRNRDLNAALLAMDAQMARYRPYLDMSFEELQKRAEQKPEEQKLLVDLLNNGSWVGMQLYYRLTPTERAALVAGQELFFSPDSADPDRRLPPEWVRPTLRSLVRNQEVEGRLVPLADVPGITLTRVGLKIKRTELGEMSLICRMTSAYTVPHAEVRNINDTKMAVGQSPSGASPGNATANAALRSQRPFDQTVSLSPHPSCRVWREHLADEEAMRPYSMRAADPSKPHFFSCDVWEAVHQATGLPIVADYYTRIYPAERLVVRDQPLFEALCTVGDAMGVRWKKDGDFLLCRSTGYFWDKVKEVPNRLLQRWLQTRETNGGLPLPDLLEIAGLPDQQLDSALTAQGIDHCWGLWEWRLLGETFSGDQPNRRRARFLALLTPEQLERARQPAGLPFPELTPAQQQAGFRLQQEVDQEKAREGWDPPTRRPEEFARASVYVEYVPVGWYVWTPPQPPPGRPWTSPLARVGGRTAEEALAAARRLYPAATPQQVQPTRGGHFSAGIRLSEN